MTLLHALLLGIIEGITEFLPISSTAHLIIAQKLMGMSEVNEFFTTVVQLGAIAGLIWVERKKLIEITTEVMQMKKPLSQTLGFKLAIASLPVLLVGFFIKDYVSLLQNNMSLIAFMSIAIGFVLFLAERVAKHAGGTQTASTRELFVMGLFQCISLIPGTSRSGITAAGGAFQKMSLSSALEYSFLLSIPALLAAGGYELLKFATGPIDTSIILPTFLGAIVSFVCAILSVEWLRSVVRRQGFLPFVVYRFLFAIIILVLLRK